MYQNHTLYLKDEAEFLIYLERKLILKMEWGSLHSPPYGGGKFDLTGGVVTETHMSFDSRGNWLIEQYKNKLDRKQDFTPLMLISEYLVETAFIH